MKCKTAKIVPISLLVFVVVVIFSALGILFFKIFSQSLVIPQNFNNNQSTNVLEPQFSLGNNENNLVFNPSFEDIDGTTGKIASWDSKNSLEILTSEGMTNGKVQVFPLNGNKSLQLSNLDETSFVLATQTLNPADTPTAIYFSGWGNGDFLNTTSSEAKFYLSLTLEFSDNKKFVYLAPFNNNVSGWQFNSYMAYDYKPNIITTIYIRCIIMYGIGHAFFDNITINFI